MAQEAIRIENELAKDFSNFTTHEKLSLIDKSMKKQTDPGINVSPD